MKCIYINLYKLQHILFNNNNKKVLHKFYIKTRLPVTRWVKLSQNFELLSFPNQLY